VTYGERLRELRAERGLSLREVEERGGPNKDTMSLIERGVHKPQPQTLGRIAKGLSMGVTELRSELEAAEHPLGQAPPDTRDYGAVLKDMGFPLEQIESWREQDELDNKAIARTLENMSAKDLLELRISTNPRLQRYYRDNPPREDAPPRSESA
jgi:transcriptional regulator with XRE-family HTH domain